MLTVKFVVNCRIIFKRNYKTLNYRQSSHHYISLPCGGRRYQFFDNPLKVHSRIAYTCLDLVFPESKVFAHPLRCNYCDMPHNLSYQQQMRRVVLMYCLVFYLSLVIYNCHPTRIYRT